MVQNIFYLSKLQEIHQKSNKPKSVIRPCSDFLDYFLRSFGFYKMPFACFYFVIASYHSLKVKQNPFF